MSLIVNPHSLGKKLHRLGISYEGQFIGEYERAQLADIERKKDEINCAADLLVEIFKQHGEFKVRWNGKRREKIIYTEDIERAVIPKLCWRQPSWAK